MFLIFIMPAPRSCKKTPSACGHLGKIRLTFSCAESTGVNGPVFYVAVRRMIYIPNPDFRL